MKKLLSLLLAMSLVLCLGACGKEIADDRSDVDEYSELRTELKKATSKLKTYSDDYVVSNMVESPEGSTFYLEVNSPEFSYTEYPIDADTGELGVIDEETENVDYMLTDWLASDGNMYMVEEDDNGDASYMHLPEGYADFCKSRKIMYMDLMLDEFTSIEKMESRELTFGDSVEEVDFYKCKLPSKIVKEVIGGSNLKLFESLKTTNKDNENIVKFCNFRLQDLNMNLTFSDAIVSVGVSDGMIKYINIEVGGLGTRMYMTKAVIAPDFELRDEPAFNDCEEYVDSIKDLADYVSQFDSYEEAMENMYSSDSDESSETDTDEK